jgi:hypothetical protein
VLGALPSAFCRALGKVLLSVKKMFAESRTLGIGLHSVEISLPSVWHSAKGGSRQRVVSRRLKLTPVTFAENRVLALDKESSLPSATRVTLGITIFAECLPWALDKVDFIFYFVNQTFCGMFLHYVDLHVPFWDKYKSVYNNYWI